MAEGVKTVGHQERVCPLGFDPMKSPHPHPWLEILAQVCKLGREGNREEHKWRVRTLRSLQVPRHALNLSFPHAGRNLPCPARGGAPSLRSLRRARGRGGGTGRSERAVGNPRARACALPISRRFRFSVSSQSSNFSVLAQFPESTWCGSSQQPPPSRRSLLTAWPQRPQWRT